MGRIVQRYYDPVLGRFLSADPVLADDKGGDFNRYWYANNNPYKFTDKDGRKACLGQLACDSDEPWRTTQVFAAAAAAAPKPTQPAKTEPRKSTATLRKFWEKMTGEKWPKDPATGRNQDLAHKDAVADGGKPNDPNNFEPKPHDQHMQEHKDNGDFKRWGSRSGSGGARGPTSPETPPVAPEPIPVETPLPIETIPIEPFPIEIPFL